MTDRTAAEIAAAALEAAGFYSWRLCDWAEEIVEEVVELKDDDRDLELVAAELADSAVPIATLAAVELASSCLDLLCVEPQASTYGSIASTATALLYDLAYSVATYALEEVRA
jgi:hypothetical protein